MSDTPPPDELVTALASAFYDEGVWCGECDESGPCSEGARLYRNYAERELAVLAEWADGGLIDPSTWTVVEVKPTGWDWCSLVSAPLPTRLNINPCGNDAALVALSPRDGER